MCTCQRSDTLTLKIKSKRRELRKTHQLTIEERQEIIKWRDTEKIPNNTIRMKCKTEYHLFKFHLPILSEICQ